MALSFAKFMASPVGRIVRIVAGVALIVIGLLNVQGIGGIILAVVGLVPIYAGVQNVCLISPLIGAPYSGEEALRS